MSEHVSHNLLISPKGKFLTVGDLRTALKALKVPNDTRIKSPDCAEREGWRFLANFSYCRPAKEVSLW